MKQLSSRISLVKFNSFYLVVIFVSVFKIPTQSSNSFNERLYKKSAPPSKNAPTSGFGSEGDMTSRRIVNDDVPKSGEYNYRIYGSSHSELRVERIRV